MTARFEESTVAAAADLRTAVEADDAVALRAHAHKLAGGAANLGAREVVALARELEALGESGTTPTAARTCWPGSRPRWTRHAPGSAPTASCTCGPCPELTS